VNLSGDINTACNGAGGGGGGINLAGFDTTLSPDPNALGTITVTLPAGSNQFAAFYADYDVSYATYGSFDDFAATFGALPAGWSFSVNDPNVSNLFNDFANNTLDNTNNQPTPSGPPNQCCDVAFALSIPASGGSIVTFVVSGVAPTSGFYIQQTNQDTGESIYLQGSTNQGGTIIPEPSSLAMCLLAGGGFLLAGKRFRKAR
jgi:hypothetical protein